MTGAHRRYLAKEAAIGAAINAALSLAFCLLLFARSTAVPVGGAHGLIADAAPQTFMVALMSMLVPALLTRRRCRAGLIKAVGRRHSLAPGRPVLRAFCTAAVVAAAAVALHAFLLPLGPPAWPLALVVPAKTIYGALLGAMLTYASVTLALRDGAGAASGAARRSR